MIIGDVGAMEYIRRALEYFELLAWSNVEEDVNRSRSEVVCTNNLPPLLFHRIHGENIEVCNSGTVARRIEGFCYGLTFTNRPVKVNEKIFIKIKQVSTSWNGAIRFGLTTFDPATLSSTRLPKYACPDLTNKPGYWAKAMRDRYAEENNVLYFYINSNGNVNYGVNGESKGVLFTNVDIRQPLWALFDVYGNTVAIELVDCRLNLNNAASDVRELRNDSMHEADTLISLPTRVASSANVVGHEYSFVPLPFNAMICGRNVRLSQNKLVASRSQWEYSEGCVFSSRQFMPNECLGVQILCTDSTYVGGLAFGVTSCNPAVLTPSDLHVDIEEFLNREEYWVVKKDVANSPVRADELLFWFSENGDVMMRKNNGQPQFVFHADVTVPLWPFFELYGSTLSIRIFISDYYNVTSLNASRNARNVNRLPVTTLFPDHPTTHNRAEPPIAMLPHFSSEIELLPRSDGGARLVLNIPPSVLNQTERRPSSSTPSSPYRNSTISTTSSGSYSSSSTSVVRSPHRRTICSVPSQDSSSPRRVDEIPSQMLTSSPSSPNVRETDCIICHEQAIDTALYHCGHMCLCYNCALQLWKGRGDGHCPICRAHIVDVMRVYRA